MLELVRRFIRWRRRTPNAFASNQSCSISCRTGTRKRLELFTGGETAYADVAVAGQAFERNNTGFEPTDDLSDEPDAGFFMLGLR